MKADADVCQLIDDVLAAERPETSFDQELWETFTEVGLHRLTGAEEVGGSGLGWAEAAHLAAGTARRAVAVPAVDHDLLAGWLADQIDQPTGELTAVAILDDQGQAASVAWAPVADTFALVWSRDGQWRAAVVPAASVRVTPVAQLAGRPTGTVHIEALPDGVEVAAGVVDELRARGCLARAVQMSGAMEHAVALCVEHLTTRVQFGRPLAKFQALQHRLVAMAGEVVLARAAVDAALATVDATGFTGPRSAFAIAAARSTAGHAVSTVVPGAHQLHGAIGTTQEHVLHHYTTALLAWRSEWGGTVAADRTVGERMLAAGSSGAWDVLVGEEQS